MGLTIYQDDNFGGYQQEVYFNVYDTGDYYMSWYSDWNDEISSLYTSSSIYVFEDAGYSGNYALLPAGYHDLDSLYAYGVDNDSISSIAFA
jgi:hypothetical protein